MFRERAEMKYAGIMQEKIDPSGVDDIQPDTEVPRGTIVPFRLPTRHNRRLGKLVDIINADADVFALWECANVNAVTRLGSRRLH